MTTEQGLLILILATATAYLLWCAWRRLHVYLNTGYSPCDYPCKCKDIKHQ